VIWVLIAVIVVLLLVVGLLVYRQRRSTQLREGFGPEYDRALDEHGDRRAAESELLERRERRRSYDIKPLGPAARDRYAERWRITQANFVDQPASALTEADTLVGEVMRERGYPVEDFEQQAADPSCCPARRTRSSSAGGRRSRPGSSTSRGRRSSRPTSSSRTS